MPQLIVKGITQQECAQLSVTAAPELAQICNCPSDWFVFDHINSTFFDENGKMNCSPVVQVWWFKRPIEVQNKVALYLTKQFESFGYKQSQISFHLFEPQNYYENGENF